MLPPSLRNIVQDVIIYIFFFQQTRIIYIRYHTEHQIRNAEYFIFVYRFRSQSVCIYQISFNPHRNPVRQPDKVSIYRGGVCRLQGAETFDHTSRQKRRSSRCYSHVAPTRAQHLRVYAGCKYQKRDLIHSIIKHGIRYSLIKGLYQNNTNQLCQDISDKNWETSQCIMNSLVSSDMKPHDFLFCFFIFKQFPTLRAHL